MIMTALAALIAARLLRHPRYVSLIIPLWNRINRAARRFERLMAHLAAGTLPKPRLRPGRPGGPRATALPTGRAWLVAAIGYEAAGLASQLAALLAESGAAELLAQAPTVGRILHPVERMLGIGAYAPRPRPVRPVPAAKPDLEFIPPGKFLFRSHGHTWYEAPTPPLRPG
jgi:hypothetical protein